MVDDRDTQVSFNGSFTLSFASQVLFDKAEYFDHINTLLAQQTILSEPALSFSTNLALRFRVKRRKPVTTNDGDNSASP